MQAPFGGDIYHGVLRMLLAKLRFSTPLYIESGPRRTGVMKATSTIDVHHAVLSVFFAVHGLLGAFEIKASSRPAAIVLAVPHSGYGL